MVVAPFDGVITRRNVDVGSLVQGDVTGGTFVFEIQQKGVIRVWVYVPQDAAFGVAPGVDAIVPAEAIIFNRNGLQVAVVEDGKAEIRKVSETRDMGTQVEVDAEVKAGDRVIINRPVNLLEGDNVRPAAP